MSTEALFGFVGVGLLVVANIAVVAFRSGRLSQKVDDLSSRVSRVEVAINGWLKSNCDKEDKE